MWKHRCPKWKWLTIKSTTPTTIRTITEKMVESKVHPSEYSQICRWQPSNCRAMKSIATAANASDGLPVKTSIARCVEYARPRMATPTFTVARAILAWSHPINTVPTADDAYRLSIIIAMSISGISSARFAWFGVTTKPIVPNGSNCVARIVSRSGNSEWRRRNRGRVAASFASKPDTVRDDAKIAVVC